MRWKARRKRDEPNGIEWKGAGAAEAMEYVWYFLQGRRWETKTVSIERKRDHVGLRATARTRTVPSLRAFYAPPYVSWQLKYASDDILSVDGFFIVFVCLALEILSVVFNHFDLLVRFFKVQYFFINLWIYLCDTSSRTSFFYFWTKNQKQQY